VRCFCEEASVRVTIFYPPRYFPKTIASGTEVSNGRKMKRWLLNDHMRAGRKHHFTSSMQIHHQNVKNQKLAILFGRMLVDGHGSKSNAVPLDQRTSTIRMQRITQMMPKFESKVQIPALARRVIPSES
jgi:hypothetical protein